MHIWRADEEGKESEWCNNQNGKRACSEVTDLMHGEEIEEEDKLIGKRDCGWSSEIERGYV